MFDLRFEEERNVGVLVVASTAPLVILCYRKKQRQEMDMAKGLYRYADEWVMVDYGTNRASIPRNRYDDNKYEPPFEQLPTEEQYKAAQSEKSDVNGLEGRRS